MKTNILIFLTVATFVSGCGSLQNKISKAHEQIAANVAQTTAVATKTASTPPVTLSVTGSSNNVPLTITAQPMQQTFTTGTGVVMDSTDDSFSKSRLPFTVALVCGAIGLLLAALAFSIWRKQSAAFNVAYTGFDNFLASQLSHPGTTTEVSNILNAVRAEFNKTQP